MLVLFPQYWIVKICSVAARRFLSLMDRAQEDGLDEKTFESGTIKIALMSVIEKAHGHEK